jgi:hypothetical protein
MWVAQEWRSMCGEAWRPEAADDALTICQMRWRVNLRPPRAMNKKFFVDFEVENLARSG